MLAPEGADRGVVYTDWLRERFSDAGADLDHAQLDAFHLSTVLRRSSPDDTGRRRLLDQRGPDARFSGRLTVREPERFGAALGRGLGRHRAFGFGMLLLRPA